MFKILSIFLATFLFCSPVLAQQQKETAPTILDVVHEDCPEEQQCGGNCCSKGECCNTDGFCCKKCPDTMLCKAQGRCIEIIDGCASCVDCR